MPTAIGNGWLSCSVVAANRAAACTVGHSRDQAVWLAAPVASASPNEPRDADLREWQIRCRVFPPHCRELLPQEPRQCVMPFLSEEVPSPNFITR